MGILASNFLTSLTIEFMNSLSDLSLSYNTSHTISMDQLVVMTEVIAKKFAHKEPFFFEKKKKKTVYTPLYFCQL